MFIRTILGMLTAASLTIAPQGFSIPGMLVAVAEAPAMEDTPEFLDPFVGYPTLKRICSCESNLRQYALDGETALRGTVNSYDIGICQINEIYHGGDIEKLGVDIHTEKGNIAFAKNLYDRKGSAPWIWSKPCWSRGDTSIQ